MPKTYVFSKPSGILVEEEVSPGVKEPIAASDTASAYFQAGDLCINIGANCILAIKTGDSVKIGATTHTTLNAAAVGLAGLFKKGGSTGEGVQSSDWTRPSEWIALPAMASTDRKFAGLFAVFNDRPNELNIISITGYSATIDWGDGTNNSMSGTYSNTKLYNYTSISSPVLTDELGRIYKHVKVEITWNALDAPQLYLSRKCNHWLDLKLANQSITLFSIRERLPLCLKILNIVSHNISNGISTFADLHTLEVLNVDPKFSNSQTTFANLSNTAKDLSGNPLSFTFTGTDVLYGAAGMQCSKLGTITANNTTSANHFLRANLAKEIGTVTIPLATTAIFLAAYCPNLIKLNVTTGANLANISNAFDSSPRIEEVSISNCSGVTNAANLFSLVNSLKKLTMTGMRASFSVANTNMSASALDDLGNSVGTALSAATITVTGTPGAATMNTSIWTSKGWTIIN